MVSFRKVFLPFKVVVKFKVYNAEYEVRNPEQNQEEVKRAGKAKNKVECRFLKVVLDGATLG